MISPPVGVTMIREGDVPEGYAATGRTEGRARVDGMRRVFGAVT